MAQDCTKAVELNPKYVKALFRRAKAHEKLDNKKECLEGEYALLKGTIYIVGFCDNKGECLFFAFLLSRNEILGEEDKKTFKL